jgi:hypothetical protein
MLAEKGRRDAGLDALVTERGFRKPEKIASAVLFLPSDEERLITGVEPPVDAGFTAPAHARQSAVSLYSRPKTIF